MTRTRQDSWKDKVASDRIFTVVAIVLGFILVFLLFGFPGTTHPLEGEAAPEMRLATLDRGVLDLGDHLGRDVIVLDFWASWCGPCRYSMPILERIAKDYADRIVFSAVNSGEPPQVVARYLEQEGLDIPVSLDTDQRVSVAFQANALPTTVVIGRDGVIHEVHVGAGPGYESQLRRDIESLLARSGN